MIPENCVTLHQPYFDGIPYVKAVGPSSFTFRKEPRGRDEWFNLTDIHFTSHSGTHVDAARHLFDEANSIDQYPVDRFMGPGIVLDVQRTEANEITLDEIQRAGEIRDSDIVFLYTSWAHKYGEDDYLMHPYLSEEAAKFFVERKIKIVGIDTATPDMPMPLRPSEFNPPIHRTLLGNDVLILENLGTNCQQVLGQRLFIVAHPIIVQGADGGATPIICWPE